MPLLKEWMVRRADTNTIPNHISHLKHEHSTCIRKRRTFRNGSHAYKDLELFTKHAIYKSIANFRNHLRACENADGK